MIVTTTPSVEGKQVAEYLNIVTGEAILGANAIKDMCASFTDFFGGRSGSYEKEMGKAREIAIDEMKQAAQALGADAVVGVDIDYETLGREGSNMMFVTASGTAVKFG
ncbi:MAG: heavy metal-binding domain-containing protein [Armatimonadota bacterium]